jgi:hypothetical protein
MAVGLDRAALQRDFSAGMFRGVREDLIPPNGVYDATNGLLDNTGLIYKRGGSTYRSSAAFGSWIPFIWDGFLTGGVQRTLIASTSAFGVLNTDGTVTSLAGAGVGGPVRGTVLNGILYIGGGVTYNGTVLGTAASVAPYYGVAGNRLFAGSQDTVRFSDISATGGATTTFNANDFHQVPEGVQVRGLHGLRNAIAVFTTGGVWIISNVGFDLVDASGNVQHRIDQYSRDVIIWQDTGLAAWEGGLVVPALDGVWLMRYGVSSDAVAPFERISDPIQQLYRDYVALGYTPGLATVYRGHYILPILNGSAQVDTLVCRLDVPGRPWTRMAGFGAKVASYAVRLNPTTRKPELIGGSSAAGRVLTLNYFEPSNANAFDADGTVAPWSVQLRDWPTGDLNKNTITKLRIAYQLTDPANYNPAITLTQIASQTIRGGTEWGMFDWGTRDWGEATQTALPNTAPESPQGLDPYTWHMAKKERFARFKLDCTTATGYLTLRWAEIYVRSDGRR